MRDIIRDSTLGQIVRVATRNKLLLYPEENPSFVSPKGYNDKKELRDAPVREGARSFLSTASNLNFSIVDNEDSLEITAIKDEVTEVNGSKGTRNNADLEKASTVKLQHTKSRPILPTKSSDGTILVDWYRTGTQRSY